MDVEIPYNNQSLASTQSDIYCFDDIHYTDETLYHRFTHTKAKIVQKSISTSCAEEDNVNVPVFHPSAQKFLVTAKHPRYMTFMNNRGPDWRNCPMSRAFWEFRNFGLLSDFDQQSDVARLVSQMGVGSGIMIVEFALKGPSTGSIDSEIGTDIGLNLEWMPENIFISVSLSYMDRYSYGLFL